MKSVLGIIIAFDNDNDLRELTEHRTVAAVQWGGRYRIVDFMLSNMVNSGIYRVGILMKDKYQSLIDHVGNAKDWDLSRKNSGVTILPPYSYSKKASPLVTGEYRGKIDALANIAGVLDVAMRPIDDFLTSDLDTTLTVNVKGTMYVTRAAVKQFIAQGYGTIATVASVGGVNGNGSAAYTVSKGAEVALTKHIALRFANGEQKIRANCVCPGTVMTPMTTRAMKARGKYTKAAKAMQASTAKHSTLDVGTCSDLDIAKILLFLCSDDSAPLNGQALVADYGANL